MVESVTDAVVGGSIGVAIGGWKGQLDERGGLFFFFKKKKKNLKLLWWFWRLIWL